MYAGVPFIKGTVQISNGSVRYAEKRTTDFGDLVTYWTEHKNPRLVVAKRPVRATFKEQA